MKQNAAATEKPRQSKGGTKVVKFTPKRGRPTAEQLAAIDASILSTAREMFLTKGFAETSMDAVAATAGVSKGTLYSRYADKTRLFFAVAQDRLNIWRTELPQHDFGPEVGLPERLFQRGVGLLAAFRDPEVSAFSRLMIGEAGRFPELSKAFGEEGMRHLVEMIRSDISLWASETNYPIADARGVALVFIGGIYGLNTMLNSGEFEDEPVGVVSRLVAIVLGGKAAW